MATSKEITKLEGRVDALRNDVGYLTDRLNAHIDATASHTRSWMQHKGTLFGALGPILVAIFEIIRHFI